jgi:hypothetical protein
VERPLKEFLRKHDAEGGEPFWVIGVWKQNLVRFAIEPDHARVTYQRLLALIHLALSTWDWAEDLQWDDEELQAAGLGTLDALKLFRVEKSSHADLSPMLHVTAGPPQATLPGQGNAATAFIEDHIAEKEQKLPEYQANTGLTEQWLLLVTGTEMKAPVLPAQIEGHQFVSQFERVYLLDFGDGTVLRVVPPMPPA